MKYDVKNSNGILRAVRGDTRDKSQYFTALRAVIVVMAFITELTKSIQMKSEFIDEKSINQAKGSNAKKENKRVPQANEYSSSESVFLISV
jgi:Ca2+/H+ antiporter